MPEKSGRTEDAEKLTLLKNIQPHSTNSVLTVGGIFRGKNGRKGRAFLKLCSKEGATSHLSQKLRQLLLPFLVEQRNDFSGFHSPIICMVSIRCLTFTRGEPLVQTYPISKSRTTVN